MADTPNRANLLDRAIAVFSPSTALRRAQFRNAFNTYARSSVYEGASKGRRTDGWRTGTTGAVAVTASGHLNTLRDRTRHLIRNNPYAAKAQKAYAGNIVGTGIVPRIAHQGKTDSKQAKAIAALWDAWADAPGQCDADGMLTFYGIEGLSIKTIAAGGEVLIRRRWVKDKGLVVPFQIQLLEPEFLDTSKDTLRAAEDGSQVIQGIKFSKSGKRMGYYILKQHPGDAVVINESVFVDAADIIHTFLPERPGQVRGVPWYAPIIIRMRDFDEYEDAQLVRQKIAACFAVLVTDSEAGAPAPGVGTTGKHKMLDTVEPGMIEIMPPGKEVSFANPPGVDGYADYSSITLRAIAAGLGMPYEVLTGDLSKVNFSSGRMGWLEFQRFVDDVRWNMLIPMLCAGVFKWFLDAAELAGNNVEGVTAMWTAPRREMIDPVSETKATISAIRAGLTTLPEEIRKLGDDPDKVFKETAETNKTLDKLGIVSDADPRKVTMSGQVQVAAAPDNTDATGQNNSDNANTN